MPSQFPGAAPRVFAARGRFGVVAQRGFGPSQVYPSLSQDRVDYRKAISQARSIFEYVRKKREPKKGDAESRYTVRGRKAAEAYEQFVKEVLNHG